MTLLVLASATASADPLPEGRFILGRSIWDETTQPRYVVLQSDGAALELRFAWVAPLSHERCERDNLCDWSTLAATARAEIAAGRLRLSQIEIDREAILSDDPRRPDAAQYTERVLSLLDGAAFEATGSGFELQRAGQALPFHPITDEGLAAIRAFILAFNFSVRDLDGCEVRGLAQLFAEPAPSEREIAFRRALRGLVLLQDAQFEMDALFRSQMDRETEETHAQMQALMLRNEVPFALARAEPRGDESAIDAAWRERFSEALDGDRGAYDEMIAHFGDALGPLIDFFNHLPSIDVTVGPDVICADLSRWVLPAE